MVSHRKPGIDPSLSTRFGMTRDGQPLSVNRLPAPDIAPWVGWLYATSVAAPADYQLECGLLNDTAMVRIQLEGDWTARTRDGLLHYGPKACYFGPQTRAMPVSVTGSFVSVGLALKPGAGFVITGRPAAEFADRMVDLEEMGLPGQAAVDALSQANTGEELLQTLEALIRVFLGGARPAVPPAISASFEMMALTDPGGSVATFAEDHGISLRQLERLCQRDFGMTPKQVLRRARALDMASHLRGVADSAEEDAAILRYYDQSHMAREFTDLFGMSPRQFVENPQPLMTLALESRQARRLALLDRLPPGTKRPWEGR
jgi:AraC-like DNA-binding protein